MIRIATLNAWKFSARKLRPSLPDNGSLEECNSGEVKSENRLFPI